MHNASIAGPVQVTVVYQSQPIVAGVDGCPGGWLALVDCKDGQPKPQVFARFADLLDALPKAKVIAVDIPIGLPEVGARACDRHARQELAQPRGSSVFPAPLRAVLAAGSWKDACAIRLQIEGKKMSKQAWGIVSKVREVDTLLCKDAELAARVFEVHPEVSFAAWAGKPMPHSKKKAAGRLERLKLILAEWPDAVTRCRAMLAGESYEVDDLYDAFAALWTARRISAKKSPAIPSISARDSNGLPMRIAV
jgi:predicted RNase H-like nuclease